MKKVIFVIAVVTFFTACGGSKTESCQTSCDSTKVDSIKVIKDSIK